MSDASRVMNSAELATLLFLWHAFYLNFRKALETNFFDLPDSKLHLLGQQLALATKSSYSSLNSVEYLLTKPEMTAFGEGFVHGWHHRTLRQITIDSFTVKILEPGSAIFADVLFNHHSFFHPSVGGEFDSQLLRAIACSTFTVGQFHPRSRRIYCQGYLDLMIEHLWEVGLVDQDDGKAAIAYLEGSREDLMPESE